MNDLDVEKLKRENEWLKAAHWLLANEYAFIGNRRDEPEGDIQFFLAGKLLDGTPTLALNCNDTFYYACADAEPFRYSDAPMLVDIAQREGWPGMVRWAAEQRKMRGEKAEVIAPVARDMDAHDSALKSAKALIAQQEIVLADVEKTLKRAAVVLKALRGAPGGTGHVCMLHPPRTCPKCEAEQQADLLLMELEGL